METTIVDGVSLEVAGPVIQFFLILDYRDMVKNVSTGSNPPKNNTAGELVTETIPEMQVTSSSDLKGLSKDQKETFTKLTLS